LIGKRTRLVVGPFELITNLLAMPCMLDYDEGRLALLKAIISAGTSPSSSCCRYGGGGSGEAAGVVRERHKSDDDGNDDADDQSDDEQENEVPYADPRLPRLPLSRAFGQRRQRSRSGGEERGEDLEFMSLLRRHGYVILTGMRRGEALYRTLETEMMGAADSNQRRRPQGQEDGPRRGFFLSSPAGSAAKAACRGEVYESERGVPMWRCGYEFVEDKVREAFRVHAAAQAEADQAEADSQAEEADDQAEADSSVSFAASSAPLPSSFELQWPSPAARAAWVRLVAFCRGVTDAALAAALTDAATAATAATDDATNATNATTATTAAAVAEARRKALRVGEDFSVAYALHYPNEEGGAPTLPPSVTGGVTHINVKVSQLASQQVTQVTQSSSVRLSRQ
jgi:hypothetical protein